MACHHSLRKDKGAIGMERLLKHLGVTNYEPIGKGIEATVYDMDGSNVLRIATTYKPEETVERDSLLAVVRRGSYPFAVPDVMHAGEFEGSLYTIERKMSGKTLREILPKLSGWKRRQAVENFLLGIDHLKTASVDDLPYGELIGNCNVQSTEWSTFLRAQVAKVLMDSKDKLVAAVPNMQAVFSRFDEGTKELESYGEKHLVHGDYYPAHVMMDDNRNVTGLLDFSRLTVIGDPDLDRAEALSTFEDSGREGATPEDARYFRFLLMERFGKDVIYKLRTYQLFYALIFSGCEHYDPATYEWCLKTLRGELWPE
jgi:aminoglycoside phosphotransferase (APT) family kinase protein